MAAAAGLSPRGLRKGYGAAAAIRGVDPGIPGGPFMGSSGCGEATPPRMIAGLEGIASGHLLTDGRHVNDRPPRERGAAMVCQTCALAAPMTARHHRPRPHTEAARMAKAVRIFQAERLPKRRPPRLLGGRRRRVAITRHPKAFLCDAPTSNLLTALRMEIGQPAPPRVITIRVAHGQVEAMAPADTIVAPRDGA